MLVVGSYSPVVVAFNSNVVVVVPDDDSVLRVNWDGEGRSEEQGEKDELNNKYNK